MRGERQVICFQRATAFLSLLCLFASAGCGGGTNEGRLDVFPASGKVLIQSQPASGVLVVLHPAEGSPAAQKGVKPSATTKADGTFQLSSYEQNDGAPPGEYSATIQWFQSSAAPANGRPALPAGFVPPSDRFQGKFKDPRNSPWKMTISEGENDLKPIEIQ
jgi:hypothetical protein